MGGFGRKLPYDVLILSVRACSWLLIGGRNGGCGCLSLEFFCVVGDLC